MLAPSQNGAPETFTLTHRRPYWREAATVMLTAKHTGTRVNQQDVVAVSDAEANRNMKDHKSCDYLLMMLKRSPKSKFMADRLVFPGGVVSTNDICDDWREHFVSITGKPFGDVISTLKVDGDRPGMMRNSHDWSIPPEVAFRICGIRETFEESGVLLARSQSDFQQESDEMFRPLCGKVYDKLSIDQLKTYRKLVHKDDSKFLEMCQKLDIVPDIWSLNEWNNVLTPVLPGSTNLVKPPVKPYRFDTMFFLCCVDTLPMMVHDKGEMVESKWLNPSDIILPTKLRHDIAMPQLWEMGRIANMTSLYDLAQFARSRERYGLKRELPVIYVCADGFLELMEDSDEDSMKNPTEINLEFAHQELALGDDLYPKVPDLEGHGDLPSSDLTAAELLERCEHVYHSIHPAEKGSGFHTKGKHPYKERTINMKNIEIKHGRILPNLIETRTKSSL